MASAGEAFKAGDLATAITAAQAAVKAAPRDSGARRLFEGASVMGVVEAEAFKFLPPVEVDPGDVTLFGEKPGEILSFGRQVFRSLTVLGITAVSVERRSGE